MKYVCDACGWEYDEAAGDPENGIAPGTKFEDLPDDFTCPLCGVVKKCFRRRNKPVGGVSAAAVSSGRNRKIRLLLMYIAHDTKKDVASDVLFV